MHTNDRGELDALGGRLWRWATTTLLPFWADVGFDTSLGSFREQLTPSGEPDHPGFTRLRVQARQTFVFADAHTRGAGPWALPAARAGYALLGRCRDPERGGYPTRLAPDGSTLDPTIDLYDQAFVLLACAAMYRATGEPEPLERTRALMTVLEQTMAHDAGGYAEGIGPAASQLPRRQNPHMHLLEALLALHATTGDTEWLTRAEPLVALCAERWIDDSGALAEFFADDWGAWPGAEGRVREPGHQFEWVWLLDQYRKAGGELPVDALAQGLFDFAWRYGLDRRPGMVWAAMDGVDDEGGQHTATKRFWPQTEAVKACLTRVESGADPNAAIQVERLWSMMFTHYLRWDDALLRDHLSADGATTGSAIPASSLYHLWVALTETVRVGRGAAFDW